MPQGLYGLSCKYVLNNKIFCFGGGLNSGLYTNQIMEYDTDSGVLIIKSAILPSNRFYLSCSKPPVTINVYCFGGYDGSALNQIVEYKPLIDNLVLRKVILPIGRYGHVCETQNINEIYCFGGQQSGGGYLSQIVRYVIPNIPPILSPIGSQIIDENQTLTIQLGATDLENDTLTFSTNAGSVLPSPFTFTQINNNEAIFEWVPTFSDQGNYSVTFSVTDSADGSDSEIISITVNQVNLPPVLQPIGNQIITENQQITIQLQASDFDNDPLIFGTNAASILPNSFNFNSNTGLFQWIPTYTSYGNYTVTFYVTDGQYTDEETIQINVNDANTANLFYIGTPTPGNTINFILGDSAASSQIYILALALGNDQPIILSDQRIIPLNADGGFYLSLGAPSSIGLSNSLGFFNPLGNAISTWTIPSYLPSGLMVKAAYISVNPTVAVPQGIISISNAVSFTIN